MDKKIQTSDPRIKFIALRLTNLTKANADRWFNAKFNKWLFHNSHSKGLRSDAPKDKNPLKTDFNGNLEFGFCNGQTKYGIELTTKDFIEYELKQLRSFDLEKLDLDHRKQVELYRDYLNSNLKNETKDIHKKETKLNNPNEHPRVFIGLDNTNFESFSDKWHGHILEHSKDKTKASILYHACIDMLSIKLTQSAYLVWVSETFEFDKPSKVSSEYALSNTSKEALQKLK
ncbi:hypothetical protein ES692_05915 [Psychroserpens burtonensis]|uniref:Uncharacterized protein n=1 Tax=Psychroserpens burtonensis TaxID=49278 RepID=A0A5C7BAB4_9FLAO|nr:hypothetical protein [Psychroserpens burtonensis]TXE18577.1 hypothetical protein ES692_05915 [Psychroserpens burtonensis]